MHNPRKVGLIILDGWGKGKIAKSDAILQANTPFVDSLYKTAPNAELITFGEDVGLPEGQMGNSEVGHLNIGAGRVVYQELARINKAIREKTLHKNEALLEALHKANEKGGKVHFFGLVSDGGVHSHINHIKALCDIANQEGCKHTFVHVFTDGRDTDPKSGYGFVASLQEHIADTPVKIASVTGRYYAMDRDNRWERIKVAYDAMVHGIGTHTTEILEAIQDQYASDKTDEFMDPIIHVDATGQPIGLMEDGDVLICFNFRTDRPREISIVLTQEDKPEYDMQKLMVDYVTMTRYDDTYQNVSVMYHKDDINLTLGEVLANAGKTQVRIAETEKYPHVTFFFSGGRESNFTGESRIMIPSPKVATYDLQPEMSAFELAAAMMESIQNTAPDFFCLNFANADMVGHTGDFKAAEKAAETVDTTLQQLATVALAHDYDLLVIADHGNSDYMINEDGSPNTAHTINPVPVFYLSNHPVSIDIHPGKLADIAPTILFLMGIEAPSVMDGENLLQ